MSTRWERIQERARARAARAERRAAAAGNPLPSPMHQAAQEIAGTPFSDVEGRPIWFSSFGRNAACFLIMSGPSLLENDLSLLQRRGIFSIGVNNSPAVVKPNVWTLVDPVCKFHSSIWLDPSIIKSVPNRGQILHGQLRQKLPNGSFEPLTRINDRGEKQSLTPAHMPGVICHKRSADFNPATFLSEPVICWGNSKRSSVRNKHPRALSVMLAALKHAYAFGFRCVYLLGCDFHMRAEQPYSFTETKQAGAVAGNNSLYANLATMLGLLKPHFDAAGFRVFNTNENSALTTFDYVPYLEAIDAATGHIQQVLDTDGYYNKN